MTRGAEALDRHLARYFNLYLLTLGCIAVVAGWVPRLRWGFWTDETGSFWMAGGSLERTVAWPGQSLLYSLIVMPFRHPGGYQELWLRAPSLFGAAAAAYFLFRLIERVVGPGTGPLAVIPFLCTPMVIQSGTDARPYGLALAAATGCYWKFQEWLETDSRRSFVQYLAFAILVLYLHYFFAALLGVQLVHLLLHRRKTSWGTVACGAAVLLLALLPLRASLATLLQRGPTFGEAVKPGIAQLFLLVVPLGPLLAAALASLAIAVAFPGSWRFRPMDLRLPVEWLLGAPVVFFAIAHLTRYQIFASRYLLFTLPAFFILLAWCISWIGPPKHRLLILFAVLGGTVLHPALLMKTLSGAGEDWRTPLERVRAHPGGPVLVRSGLAESNRLDWRHDEHLFAALDAYPIPNPIIRVPYHLTPEVETYVREQLDQCLSKASSLQLIAADGAELVPWLEQEMKSRGYTRTSTDGGGYRVDMFQRW